MVVTDLDGTLLRSDKSVSERTLNALKGLDSQNIKFVIATARAKRSVCTLLPFNFKNMYVIYYNGAEIYNGNDLIYNQYIKANRVKKIVDWLISRFPGINLSLEIFNQLYTCFDIKVMKGWIPPYTQVDFNTFDYNSAAKILVDLRYIDDVSEISMYLPNDCKMVITDGGTLGQISHKDVSKINGIRRLAERFNLCLEDVIAFGDDYNDIDMIKECGIGVAMGNAPHEIREIANIVAGTNDEDGVAIEIEKLFYKENSV